ncbi:hypothetical protein BCR34DRAFT_615686 [Clohesyomyces aquaticus]|uniref:Uncharacterized protein n=1 Tax=Clohesyomyces aquaticus TaxID=1231657 RepID=A0A1Y1ZHH7_9PLEO|nr:hypothetical protein BCR34DRAFT_615686 [Clohesyomyces aquaticus]
MSRIITLFPSLKVGEGVVGNGGIGGSVFLNRRFMNFAEHRIGSLKHEFRCDIEKEFNDKIYTGGDNLFRVPVDHNIKDNPAEGIANGSLTVTCDDFREIFEPVVNGVLTLLEEQIKEIKRGPTQKEEANPACRRVWQQWISQGSNHQPFQRLCYFTAT